MIPRLLFRLAVVVSCLLIVLVILSPLADNGDAQPAGWAHLLALFARDPATRRTAVASAVGLLVTACVFFRPHGPNWPGPRKRKRTTAPPPPSVAGA